MNIINSLRSECLVFFVKQSISVKSSKNCCTVRCQLYQKFKEKSKDNARCSENEYYIIMITNIATRRHFFRQ